RCLRAGRALDAEVPAPEGVADRCLLRLEPLCLLERDGGLSGHAAPKVTENLLVDVVELAHRPPSARSDRSESAARKRRLGASRSAAARSSRRSSPRARSAAER